MRSGGFRSDPKGREEGPHKVRLDEPEACRARLVLTAAQRQLLLSTDDNYF